MNRRRVLNVSCLYCSGQVHEVLCCDAFTGAHVADVVKVARTRDELSEPVVRPAPYTGIVSII